MTVKLEPVRVLVGPSHEASYDTTCARAHNQLSVQNGVFCDSCQVLSMAPEFSWVIFTEVIFFFRLAKTIALAGSGWDGTGSPTLSAQVER